MPAAFPQQRPALPESAECGVNGTLRCTVQRAG